jgi:hypothetical protein
MNLDAIGRLKSHRKHITITLEHLRAQQEEIDRNTEWRDLRAQRRRSELLAELLGWYSGKLKRIDAVLDRVSVQKKTLAPRENRYIVAETSVRKRGEDG